MRSIGIIGEYNPFHEGHAYLIERAMQETGADVAVSVMSGNFTQRGEPAVSDKWERAGIALENGINAVFELPTVFACGSAETFAKGAVDILEGLGCIDLLAFGTESGDLVSLQKAADFLERNGEQINHRASELLRQGHSYPKARELAVKEIDPAFDAGLISEPNNILALEYMKYIRTMQPFTIKRSGEGYHQSGSRIRAELTEKQPERFEHMEKLYFSHVRARILQSGSDELERLFSAGEGLGNKLKKEVRYAGSVEELIDRIKSKAYTRTRIARLLTQVLLGIDQACVENARPYLRILALDDIGAGFLKQVKKKGCCKLPILTNINREREAYPEIASTLEKDILASDIYNLITGRDLYENSDFVRVPDIRVQRG